MTKYLIIQTIPYEGSYFKSIESEEPRQALWERFKKTIPESEINQYEMLTPDEFWNECSKLNAIDFKNI